MSPRWRLAVLAGLFTLVTACGSPEDDGGDGVASMSDKDASTSSSAPKDEGTDIDKMRAYAKCMREHGIDVKDPDDSGASGGISIGGKAGEQDKAMQAHEECKQLMPNGGEPEKPSAEDLDQMRETAKCLREHGIEVKEPTMEDPGVSVSGGDPEKLNKAMEECQPEGANTRFEGKPAK